ncbi:hypothetical protein AVEN_8764-1 [Araneus ventricosus]|uniref:Uncharacterized protein n=1 Tax=Araneus ventricosus TaxID=182803 RepID=A0A4Y2SXQ1_ARAVE|nr:hypothetical protein AVEN_8764-1 [Araneus ventricosus]
MKFVLLSRFNQDALQHYFSQVRRRGGINDHPIPVYFLQSTRMLLAEGMFVMCGNANCEPDDDIILESTQIIPQTLALRAAPLLRSYDLFSQLDDCPQKKKSTNPPLGTQGPAPELYLRK